MSSVPPVSNIIQLRPRGSSGKLTDFSTGQRFDRYRYCAGFNDRWAALLRAEFGGNAVDCASRFGVTERAAGKWMDGIGGPRGDKVGIAVRTIPGAADWLFSDALAVAA